MEIKEMKRCSNNAIIKEIEKIYGIEKCIDEIKNYAEYLQLRKQEHINIGNYNVLVKCQNEYIQIEKLVQLIIELLRINNIADSSYLYIEERQLRNTYRPNDIEDKEIVIVDSDIVNLSSSHLQNLLKQYMQNNRPKIFIIIDKENNYYWRDEFKSKDIFWTFELEEISDKEKANYIRQVLKQDNMKLDNKCKLLNSMCNNEYDKIQKDLLNIIIECKSKNIDKITDKVLEDLDKREYLRIRNNNTKITSEKKTGMQELNSLQGLDDVKQQITSILNYIKVNKNRGTLPSLHMSFEGNPGTGKTSIARVIGKIFSEEKILSNKKKFVEINARELVAKYVGWTAVQTKEIIEKAEGGVLFIDESYALISDEHSFEQEAIDTLIKLLEDKRDSICVIFAGYTKEMQKLFEMNPGFASRINFHIQFPDYAEEELYSIFKKMLKKEKYKLSNNSKDIILDYFRVEKTKEHFSNGRCARNFFERIKFAQADRVATDSTQDINLIKKCDVQKVIDQLEQEQQVDIKRTIGFCNG